MASEKDKERVRKWVANNPERSKAIKDKYSRRKWAEDPAAMAAKIAAMVAQNVPAVSVKDYGAVGDGVTVKGALRGSPGRPGYAPSWPATRGARAGLRPGCRAWARPGTRCKPMARCIRCRMPGWRSRFRNAGFASSG